MKTLCILVLGLCLNGFITPVCGQSCTKLTAEDLGNSTAPTANGLIAERLADDTPYSVEVQLVQYNLVCEATAGMRGRYRHVSVVAEYYLNDSLTMSQFEFSCASGDVWGIVVSGSSENTVTTPPDATLNSTLRRDCFLCLSPRRAGNNNNNSEHCSGKGVERGTI